MVKLNPKRTIKKAFRTSNRIHLDSSLASYNINPVKIVRLTDQICRNLGIFSHDLSVLFVGSTKIKNLNWTYRRINRSTDILSFPQKEWEKPQTVGHAVKYEKENNPDFILGDIVISLPDAAKNAKKIGQPLARELCFLLVHGVLHLCGHDHKARRDETIMIKQQNILMCLADRKGTGKLPLWATCIRKALAKGKR